jgi:phosphatidylinositol-3-phosphatase
VIFPHRDNVVAGTDKSWEVSMFMLDLGKVSNRVGTPRHRAKTAAMIAAALVGAAGLVRQSRAASLGDIFYIDMENQNWTQPASENSTGEQPIYQNTAAPYINSLVTPGNPNAAQVSYASAYHNVLSTPTGNNVSIHPSEPNYLWQESGSSFGDANPQLPGGYSGNDNDPYGSGGAVPATATFLADNPSVNGMNLTGMIQAKGDSWKSYQEDTDLATTTNTNGNLGAGTNQLTSTPVATSLDTVPLSSFSGTSTNYTNPYNGSHQYNFACKHDGSLFFTDTNGSTTTAANTSTSNPEVSHYAPMQQLTTDLANNTVGQYNLITPDQFNDMHTALTGGFTYNGTHYTGDNAQIAQGDNFLSIVVPEIEASNAYKNNGAIVIWCDETEGGSGVPGGVSGATTQNDFNHTLMEIVISPLAKGNAYNSTLDYTHSSDVATLQEVYQVSTNGTGTGYLNDAANPSNTTLGNDTGATDLSDLFVSGTIPTAVPEPASLSLLGAAGLSLMIRRRKQKPA